MENKMSIPWEIKRFFELFPGQTLLIKGRAGTGKTILSLEILKEICDERNGLYLSTRINPEKLYSLFPWVTSVVPEKNIVNATPSKLLKAIGSTGSSRDQIFDFGSALNFFKTVYEDVEEMDNPVMVIDSWNALLDCLRISDQGAALTQSLCEFAHEVGTHLIFISETDSQSVLDYIVDGVVTLRDIEIHGESMGGQVFSEQLESRTAREIEINKLRGVKRSQKKYIYTLKDGRFQYFPSCNTITPFCSKQPSDIDENHRSSGIPNFDEIIGGLPRKDLTLFVVEHGVGPRYIPFLDQIAISLASRGIGVVRVHSIGATFQENSEQYLKIDSIYTFKPKSWITWRIDKLFPTVREYLEFLEHTQKESSEIVELSLMEFRKEYNDFLVKLREKHSNIVEFIGLDTFEILYGQDNTVKLLDEAMQRALENREILVAVAKKGMKSLEMLSKLANLLFVFKDIDGGLFIYGVQPRTGLYNISSDKDGVHLTEVV